MPSYKSLNSDSVMGIGEFDLPSGAHFEPGECMCEAKSWWEWKLVTLLRCCVKIHLYISTTTGWRSGEVNDNSSLWNKDIFQFTDTITWIWIDEWKSCPFIWDSDYIENNSYLLRNNSLLWLKILLPLLLSKYEGFCEVPCQYIQDLDNLSSFGKPYWYLRSEMMTGDRILPSLIRWRL